MANALIIKSDGGGLTVKSGGTFTVKDSGQPPPPYIIDGLTQSHWLASNAVLEGATTNISSITDISGTSNLVGVTMNAPAEAQRKFEAGGWVSGGQTLDSFRVCGPLLRSAQWPGLLSNYTGTFTIATLVQRVSSYGGTMAGMKGDVLNKSIEWMYDDNAPFSVRQGGSYVIRDWPNWAWPPLWLQNKNAFVARCNIAAGTWKIWLNNTVLSSTNSWGTISNLVLSTFVLGGNGAVAEGNSYNVNNASDCRFAEFHIYKGDLTDAQCQSIQNDMRTRGGI